MSEIKKEEEKPTETKKEAALLPLVLWLAIGIVIGIGAYYLFLQPAPSTQPPLNITAPNITVPLVPNVTVTMINYSGCSSCNATQYLLADIKSVAPQFGLKIGEVSTIDSSSSKAQALISKYSIKKLPTMIVSKEANTSSQFVSGWAQFGSIESDGSFVYRDVYPPYYDLENKTIAGFVDVVEITTDCKKCYNASQFVDYLKSYVAMYLSNHTSFDANSSEAKSLISKYSIKRLPAFLLSPGASVYSFMGASWGQYGTVESDGWNVYRGSIPPYVDLQNNSSVVGIVTMIELVDPNCTECYDVGLHYSGLVQSFGLTIDNRTKIYTNSSEGAQLISKYNITKVPTVIVSSDAALYPGFNSSWKQMGSIESDGWLVFRELDQLGVKYKNVSPTSNNISANASS